MTHSTKCPKCGDRLTDSLRQSGCRGWHLPSEIDGPRCRDQQLVQVTAERDAALALIAALRDEGARFAAAWSAAKAALAAYDKARATEKT